MPKSELPPIQSADGVDLKVGQTIYYTEKCCNRNKPYKVETGKIIQLVLTSARTVRLRKTKGREIVLSMSQNGGLCRPQGVSEELIFANRKNAVAEAKRLSQVRLEELQREHKNWVSHHNMYESDKVKKTRAQYADMRRKDALEEYDDHHKQIEQNAETHKEFEKLIAKIK